MPPSATSRPLRPAPARGPGRGRLVLGGLALGVLAALALTSMQVTVASLRADREDRLLSTGEALATALRDMDPYFVDPAEADRARARLQRLAGALGLREALVLDLGDKVLFSTSQLTSPGSHEPAALAAPETAAAAWQGQAGLSAPFHLEDVPYQAAFVPLVDEEGAVATVLVSIAGREAFELLDLLQDTYRAAAAVALALLTSLLLVGMRLQARAEAAEGDLEHGRRLAMAGQVAAGVVHEIRNPLGILRSTLEFLRDGPAEALPEDDRAALVDALEEVERIEEILERFLALARHRAPEPRTVWLREVIEGTLRLAERDLERRGLGVVLVDEAPDAAVRVDPRSLRQALLNLLLNARHALEDAEVRDAILEVRLSRPAEGTVAVAVEDPGPGFAPEVLAEPFRAFRTGREDGTGLGLPLVARFAAGAGGAARIENRPEGGARATMELPEVDPAAASMPPRAPDPPGEAEAEEG